MQILLLDTETTDLQNARLVQLAYKDLTSGQMVNELFKAPVAIGYGAMSIHHITNEMVAEKLSFADSVQYQELASLAQAGVIIVAHNAPFDLQVLKNEGLSFPIFIDTCRVAQHLIPSEQHKLQYLRYFLQFPPVVAEAHDALGDVLVLELLFNHLKTVVAEKFALEESEAVINKMIQLSQEPLLIKSLGFGKHKGVPLEELVMNDRGYLQWLYDNESKKAENEQNANLIYTLRYYLA